MDAIKLTRKQREDLANLEQLVDTINSNMDGDVDDEIRLLSIRHNITKSHLSEVRKKLLSENDLKYIEELNSRIWAILKPVYETLSDTALAHMEEWFKRIRRASGDLDPQIYEYQKELAYWLLSAIIKNELTGELYTLLVSRGSGKTYTLSIVAVFLLLHWDMYILHNKSSDWVLIVTAPQDDQLTSFRNYISEFLDVSKGEGMVSDKMSETSELELVISRKNEKEIGISTLGGANFAKVYFRLGASSVESLHGNCLLSDESKFLTKKAIQTSMLPTVG